MTTRHRPSPRSSRPRTRRRASPRPSRPCARIPAASTWSSSSTTAAPTTRSGIAREAGAEVVRHARNRGKAAAMMTGAGYVARQEWLEGRVGSGAAPPAAALRRRRPRGVSAPTSACWSPPVVERHGRHDHRHAAAAEDGRRRAAGSSSRLARKRDRGAHRLRGGPTALGHALPLPRGVRRREPAGPRLGRRGRADRRRPARRPARRRGALRAAPPGQRHRTGAASCTGPAVPRRRAGPGPRRRASVAG